MLLGAARFNYLLDGEQPSSLVLFVKLLPVPEMTTRHAATDKARPKLGQAGLGLLSCPGVSNLQSVHKSGTQLLIELFTLANHS